MSSDATQGAPITAATVDIDWDGERFATNAQQIYSELRELTPVVVDDRQVTVFRREHVEAVLRDPETFSSNPGAVYLGSERPLIPLQLDPPEHSRYRRILDPLFGPRQVAVMEAGVSELVASLLSTIDSAGPVDVNQAFTVPLPSLVFLRLLGLPTDDLPVFLGMKDGIIRPSGSTQDERDAHRQATGEQIGMMFYAAVEERLQTPQDDLITKLLTLEIEGERLSVEEVLDVCFLFLMAGLDTVTATLQCALVYLARHPEQRRLLVEDPSSTDAAVEELLRWESPVSAVSRVATVDTEIGGCPVRRGQPVNVLLGAANTDTAELDEPYTVDLRREPNRHIAFGRGPHRCLGSHLARLELRVALREWHKRYPDYTLVDDDVEFVGSVRQIEGPLLLSLGAAAS